MRPLSLVIQLANLAGIGYDNDNVVIMHRIIMVVNEWHGGGNATQHSNWRYLAGMFGKIISRHGSLFETLADAVMRARQQYDDDRSTEEWGGWGGRILPIPPNC